MLRAGQSGSADLAHRRIPGVVRFERLRAPPKRHRTSGWLYMADATNPFVLERYLWTLSQRWRRRALPDRISRIRQRGPGEEDLPRAARHLIRQEEDMSTPEFRINMRRRELSLRQLLVLTSILGLCLALLGCASAVKKVESGYSLDLPPQIAADIPLGEVSFLSLLDPEMGLSTIEGRLREGKDGARVFESSDTLTFRPRRTTEIALSARELICPPGDPCSCFPPEFFEGFGGAVCFCAGTTYCLPGAPCRCL